MRDLVRAYRQLIKVSWATAFVYRAQALLWLVSAVFPLVMMVVWLAVVDEAGPTGGYTRADFIAYYLAAAVLYRVATTWMVYRWDRDIRSGDLSALLLKPLDPFHHYLSDQLGWKLLDLIIIGPLIAVALVLVPALHYPFTPGRVLAFCGGLLLGLAINVLNNTALGMIGFWTTQSRNLAGLWFGVGQFLSGFIAPLALFPTPVQRVAAALPFRYTMGFPIEVLLGKLAWPAVWQGFAIGLLWVGILLVIYRVLWRRGLRRYEAVGA